MMLSLAVCWHVTLIKESRSQWVAGDAPQSKAELFFGVTGPKFVFGFAAKLLIGETI